MTTNKSIIFQKTNDRTKIKSRAIAVCLYGSFVPVGDYLKIPPLQNQKSKYWTYSLFDDPKALI